MRRASLWFGGVLALSAAPLQVQAFSQPDAFELPVTEAGGGGRYFTGSPADGFSCAVCHHGGAPPEVTLRGFPDTYTPGKEYEIIVEWTQPKRRHGLTLEIVDTDSLAAGRITMPAPEDAEDEERCLLAEDEEGREQVASALYEPTDRQIVAVADCGARRARFAFKAPDEPKIALTASLVASDDSDDIEGDGVFELRRIAYRNGESRPSPQAGCSAAPRAGGSSGAGIALAVGAMLWGRRRTARCRR